jgi:hypothetical protein
MSALRTKANTLRDQFYINTATVVSSATTPSDTYTVTGGFVAISPNSSDDALTAGLVLVRDMGKTVRLTATNGGIRLLRKVQRVTNASLVTNDGVSGLAATNPQYGVFYIELLNTMETGAVKTVKWASIASPY